ncbi:MAG: hypothetical protein ACI4EX_06465 [Lachnospiraceae bacterium]
MEENKTIFDYIGQFFATFGIIVTIFIVLGSVIGEKAKNISTLFSLGNKGLRLDTLLQLFVFALILTFAEILFVTDRVIKKMPMAARIICFFVTVTITIVGFVICFAWFPIDDEKSWIGFFVSFTVCTVIGVGISILKEKAENKKMEQALNRFREKEL